MCFSAQADVFAAIAVGTVGVDAARHVRHRREAPLAALPLVFAVHQGVETFVWWGLEGHEAASVGRVAMWTYLVIAFAVVPILVPVAVTAIEPLASRRRLMVPFAAAAAALALVLLHAVVRGPIGAVAEQHDIAYQVHLPYALQLTALYVVVTCVPLILSSYRHVVGFGVVNLAAVALLTWLSASGFISLWCAWAAITSLAIDAHLRQADRPARLAPALSSS